MSNGSQQLCAISGRGFEWTNGHSAGVFLVGSWSFGLRTLGKCNMWPGRCQPVDLLDKAFGHVVWGRDEVRPIGFGWLWVAAGVEWENVRL